jgi:hypothetical protein
MLSTALEKMVLCGKASFNTYVIGGAEKYVLNVQSDRFIIITGITYFSRINHNSSGNRLNVTRNLADCITQLRVFSSKSNNLFTFRDNFNVSTVGVDDFIVVPTGSTQIETYLVHETDVSFTFACGGKRTNINGNFPDNTPANFPPYDYGQGADPRALPVVLSSADTSLTSLPTGLNNLVPGPFTTEFTIPVDAVHYPNVTSPQNYPLIHVQYVEILGNPTNIAATL